MAHHCFIYFASQKKTRVRLWLYEDTRLQIEGQIIGFDDLEISSLLSPPLTTVRQNLEEKGYQVNLDGDEVQIWKDFIAADVLITSKSSFSILPAFLRLDRPGVIYTPFHQDEGLRHWETVDDEFMEQTEMEMYEMERMVCPHHGEETDRNHYVDFEDEEDYS